MSGWLAAWARNPSAGFHPHLAADRVRDKAGFMRPAMKALDRLQSHVLCEHGAWPEHDSNELVTVHRSLWPVFIGDDSQTPPTGKVQEPQHVARRDRGEEQFLGIGLPGIPAPRRGAGAQERLICQLNLMRAQILLPAAPEDARAMRRRLAHFGSIRRHAPRRIQAILTGAIDEHTVPVRV